MRYFLLGAAALAGCLSEASFAADGPTIVITIRNHRFEPERPKAPAGVPFVLRVINADSTPEEFESKSLRVERVIGGGGTALISIRALQPGTYNFFGEFNEDTAQGALLVE